MKAHLFGAALAVLVTMSAAGTAAADEAHPPGPSASTTTASKPTTEWYGYQTLIADAASVGAFAVSSASGSSSIGQGFGWTGVAGYVLAAPIIHVAHGSIGKGFGSLALRVLTPLTFGVVGGMAGTLSGANDIGQMFTGTSEGIVYGMMAGAVAASAIDAIFLAREVKSAHPSSASAGPLVPWVAPSTGGVSAGVARTF